jgi:hypothetical protein
MGTPAKHTGHAHRRATRPRTPAKRTAVASPPTRVPAKRKPPLAHRRPRTG